ncbi:MAG: hypothetical protein LBO00_08680 [Zoogloeaceae bacterium]|jgi:hypothetical protein|nr:hypothetical protein [Zoogloeaceae bacterium]
MANVEELLGALREECAKILDYISASDIPETEKEWLEYKALALEVITADAQYGFNWGKMQDLLLKLMALKTEAANFTWAGEEREKFLESVQKVKEVIRQIKDEQTWI